MSTEYVQQMNQLIEVVQFAGNYWGDPKDLNLEQRL